MKLAAFAIATKKVNWVEEITQKKLIGVLKRSGEKLSCIFGLNRGGTWVVSLG